jgi:hypothetical protein
MQRRPRKAEGMGIAQLALPSTTKTPQNCQEVEPMRIDEVLQRIQGEFVEMPGLRLTAAQAQRLWGLERDVCDALLGALVDAKFLSQTRDGAFVRMDGAQPTRVPVRPNQRLAVA